MNNTENEKERLKQNFFNVVDVLGESEVTLDEVIDFIIVFLIMIKDKDKETFDTIMKIIAEVSGK